MNCFGAYRKAEDEILTVYCVLSLGKLNGIIQVTQCTLSAVEHFLKPFFVPEPNVV